MLIFGPTFSGSKRCSLKNPVFLSELPQSVSELSVTSDRKKPLGKRSLRLRRNGGRPRLTVPTAEL